MIVNFIYIATGVALGAILRFLISNNIKYNFYNIPIGTIIVNILGSFFIGLIVGYLETKQASEIFLKYFLIIGLLGSFTTFSAFSIEVIELFKNEKIFLSLIYIAASVFLSIMAAYFGYSLK